MHTLLERGALPASATSISLSYRTKTPVHARRLELGLKFYATNVAQSFKKDDLGVRGPHPCFTTDEGFAKPQPTERSRDDQSGIKSMGPFIRASHYSARVNATHANKNHRPRIRSGTICLGNASQERSTCASPTSTWRRHDCPAVACK